MYETPRHPLAPLFDKNAVCLNKLESIHDTLNLIVLKTFKELKLKYPKASLTPHDRIDYYWTLLIPELGFMYVKITMSLSPMRVEIKDIPLDSKTRQIVEAATS